MTGSLFILVLSILPLFSKIPYPFKLPRKIKEKARKLVLVNPNNDTLNL